MPLTRLRFSYLTRRSPRTFAQKKNWTDKQKAKFWSYYFWRGRLLFFGETAGFQGRGRETKGEQLGTRKKKGFGF
jgi:hypothetical protein